MRRNFYERVSIKIFKRGSLRDGKIFSRTKNNLRGDFESDGAANVFSSAQKFFYGG